MIYSNLAVSHRQDGTPICSTCGADLDPETGKCTDAQAIDSYLAKATQAALDRAIDQARDKAALTQPQRYWPD